MNVLLVNGSTNENGTTRRALAEVAKALDENGVAAEIFQLGARPVRDCVGCGACQRRGLGRCAFDDDAANDLIERARGCDGFVFGSPVYYAQPTGQLLAVLHRAFYAGIGCLFLFYGLYRAVGRPGMSVVLTVVSLGTRVVLAYALSAIPAIGVTGIWWSVPIGWFLADAVGGVYYWMKKKALFEMK